MAILDDVCAKMHAQSDGADAKFVQVTLINKKESRQQQQQQQKKKKKKKRNLVFAHKIHIIQDCKMHSLLSITLEMSHTILMVFVKATEILYTRI